MLLLFLEYTYVIVPSSQALHAAQMASEENAYYDSADEHFNEDRSALVEANQISAVAAPAVDLNDTLNSDDENVNERPRDKNKAKKRKYGTTTPLDSTEDEAPASNEEALASKKKRPESTSRKRTRGYTEEQQKVFNYLCFLLF